jgi:hypothetical protein
MSPEKILAYLWPESPSDKAGHSFRQLIHTLWRDLGQDGLGGTFPGVARMKGLRDRAPIARPDDHPGLRCAGSSFLLCSSRFSSSR